MVAARAQRTVLPGNLFAAKLTKAEFIAIQQPWFAMQHWELANPNAGSGTYLLSGWLFLRLIGLIYLTAFVSLGVQIKGLVGSKGILPARDFLLANQSWGAGAVSANPDPVRGEGKRRLLSIPLLGRRN